jgi:hypothetical protein
MTYPSGGFTNNWGPASPASSFSYPPPVGSGVPAPAANVAQTVPSPSTWEFTNNEMAASYFTSNMVSAAHDGVAFGSGDEPSPALNLSETTPAAPSGSNYEQQGVPEISNLASITSSFAGVQPSEIAVNNYGSVGNV